MSYITQILNWISSSLLLPVIVLLLLVMVASLVSLGGLCSTYVVLLRERRCRRGALEKIRRGETLKGKLSGSFGRHIAGLEERKWDELECEKYLGELQLAYERELERARFISKTAPMLGLMGTLIPMGPALADLAGGRIENMAYNMQIAFATTVVGCLAAGISLLVYSVKRHCYTEEVTDLRYVLDRRLAGRGGE